jgi:hypothetical protein
MISRRTIIILLLIALMIISGLAGTCIGIRIGKDRARNGVSRRHGMSRR